MIGSILLTTLISFVAITLFGYVVHYCLHRPFMGKFYQMHLTHHFKLYPPQNFLSEKYLDPGKDNTVVIFLLMGSPLIILPIVLFATHIISLPMLIAAMLSMAIFGIPNDLLHDAFHIKHHWLRKYQWFEKLTDLHFQHHVNIKSNYGIYFFGWDRLFGSLQKKS